MYNELSDNRLIALYKEGDADAFAEICDRYRELVKGISRAYFLVGGDGDDLLQEGLLGLLKAVNAYDENGGASFPTFARPSWGRSGMHFDYPYLALGVVENGPNYEGNGTMSPVFYNGLYNEELSWENTDQYDIGVDLDFLNYRLGIVMDYYYRYTDDLLMDVPLSGPNMYTRQWRNAAAISNEGLEMVYCKALPTAPTLK